MDQRKIQNLIINAQIEYVRHLRWIIFLNNIAKQVTEAELTDENYSYNSTHKRKIFSEIFIQFSLETIEG